MIDVSVSVSGIIMCCDESLCGLVLGRGYTIEKCNIDCFVDKDISEEDLEETFPEYEHLVMLIIYCPLFRT